MEIEQIIKKLEKIDNDLLNFEKKKSSLEGKKEQILEKLKKEFNIDENNIKEILDKQELKIDKLEKEIEDLKLELDKFNVS
jgi:hypothetical protein